MKIEKLGHIKLLLVDDEAPFRSTLSKRLQKRGFTPLQADGGLTCMEILSKHPVDVVVMDVKMPGMGGMETLQQITSWHKETEVILLTGHADTQDGVEGIKSGAFDYLTKPVEFEHLLGKIVQAYERIIGKRQKKEAAEFRARVEKQMIATERLAALGTLAAGVAHEINNPLAIINDAAGYLNALLQNSQLDDMPRKSDFEKALFKIEESVKRARSITHQLLGSVSKSESILGEVDVTELAVESIRLVQGEVTDKSIDVELIFSKNLRPIWTDPNQIRQILINLLSNAIHATPESGRITVHVESFTRGIKINISDTGTGIPKESLQKIFEPFFSTKAPGEGTGLGLFVTQEIVEKLGGAIEVKSRVGQGAQFTVQIPDQCKLIQMEHDEENMK